MLFVSFISWWYGRGWAEVAKSFGPRIRSVNAAFSVDQVLRTLFAPWRRIITYSGASLADKWRAWGDNMVSRAVGFVVRLLVLLAALLCLIVVAVLSIIETVLWPLLPVAIPGLIIAGFTA